MAVVVVIIVSVSMLTNPQFISLPDTDAVQSIEMEQFNEGSSLGVTNITDNKDIDHILSNLSGARKTMRSSTNDYPTQNNYLIVRLMLEGERRTLCLYSDGGNYYIEEPYVGIYKSNRNASVAVYKVYTGNVNTAQALGIVFTYAEYLYTHPLASYNPNGPGYSYVVGENSFSIIDKKTGEVQSVSSLEWNEQNLSNNEWEAMFDSAASVPDMRGIRYYSKTVNLVSGKYRLFNLDGEMWLAQISGDKIWCLYSLRPTGDIDIIPQSYTQSP